jgi:hypothetical protein
MTHRWTPSPDDPRQTHAAADDRTDGSGRRGRHSHRRGRSSGDEPDPGQQPDQPRYTGALPRHRGPDYRAQGYRREDFQRPGAAIRPGEVPRPGGTVPPGEMQRPREAVWPGEAAGGLEQGWQSAGGSRAVGGPRSWGPGFPREGAVPGQHGAPPGPARPHAYGTAQGPRGMGPGPHADLVTYPGWGAEREPADAEFELHGPDDATSYGLGTGRAARPARRGRRRAGKWLGIGGVVAIVAAAAVVVSGRLDKTPHHPRPSAPAKVLAVPQRIGGYTRNPQAEQELGIGHGEHYLTQIDPGHVSGIVAAVYDTRDTPGSPDSAAVIAGRLGRTPAAVVIKSFMQQEKAEGHQPVAVAPGPLGGKAACAGSKHSAICVWVDKETVGVVVSAAMNARSLSRVALTIRSGVEVRAARS